MSNIEEKLKRLVKTDSYLKPYVGKIRERLKGVDATAFRLTGGKLSLNDFASGHEYFGLHYRDGKWVFREWAPNASSIHLIGCMSDWKKNDSFALKKISSSGVWEISLDSDVFSHGDLYRLFVCWPGGCGDRIPAYTRRVVQDSHSLIFNAQVWRPQRSYSWKFPKFKRSSNPPLIYEAHIGMAQEDEKIGTFNEFTDRIIPRIVDLGYNTIQLMAVQEHPYYGSFGYQVSSFFAPSSRFGTPEELKNLVDTAHSYGLTVLMDLVHSHSVSNEVEGLSYFDGTSYQYFHEGPRGFHPAWGSRCFDYSKPEVLHFLLSNCRYWLDEFHFDGFRFDGVTSMLYLHHGIGKIFSSYSDYFNDSVDEDAFNYLTLANRVIHSVKPEALTVAEDVSGLPGLALSESSGGVGFDYRFAMGVPDYWINLLTNYADENWPLGNIWYELNNRRKNEKTIGYVESHDQALVGDKTLIFRLIGPDMYYHMSVDDENLKVARGIALHKMIRLITLATAGDGYLNFMGNEFGHPEWIDFPREGNNWSFKYAKRQWSLADDVSLKYHYLNKFDCDMISLAKDFTLHKISDVSLLHISFSDKVVIFQRGSLIFIFNFNPEQSFVDYQFTAPDGKYEMLLDSDSLTYGGYGRLASGVKHFTFLDTSRHPPKPFLRLYLPARSSFVLCKSTSFQ